MGKGFSSKILALPYYRVFLQENRKQSRHIKGGKVRTINDRPKKKLLKELEGIKETHLPVFRHSEGTKLLKFCMEARRGES